MSEHVSEERLALYAGGDLPASEAAEVGGHLRDCAQCRGALAEFEEMRNLLAASPQEATQDDLSEVRERVTSRLPREPGRTRWAWVWAGVAATVVLLMLGVRHQPSAETIPGAAGTSARATPVLAPPPVPAPVLKMLALHRTVRTPRAGLRSVALITGTDQAPLIRMTTADPNVVILWESSGGGEKE